MSSFLCLCSTSSKVPVRQVSSAVRQTSPSPCTACPSPAVRRRRRSLHRARNRQIERGIDAKLLVVHVAPELARLDGAARPVVRPRRHRQNSEEGSQKNRRAPWQRTGHRLLVDRDDAAAKLGVVFW